MFFSIILYNFVSIISHLVIYMKKYCVDLKVKSVDHLTPNHVVLRLISPVPIDETLPGQFVEVRVDGTSSVMLRRPVSINNVIPEDNEMWLLVQVVGDGTAWMAKLKEGDVVNCVFPLGNGFTLPTAGERLLLIGGGVGTAPLLYLGKRAVELGATPVFLLGAKSRGDLTQLDEFEKYGRVCITTEDGSCGERGFVTNHSILQNEKFDRIQVCGPKPMMIAVARYAKSCAADCEVSLENMMACGVGACLCCVENTVKGNLCVCKEGPVFNIQNLLWQI